LRITFLVPGRGLVGGVKVMGEYAGRLRARGHLVQIVYRRAARNLKRLAQALLRRRTRDALDLAQCPLVGVREFDAGGVPDADIVIATGLGASRAALGLPPEKGRLVQLVQGVLHLEESPDEARAVLAAPARRIAVSEFVARFLRERFGVDSVVVLNGVDHAQFTGAPRRLAEPRSVGMIYAPGAGKAAEEGLEAVRLVRQRWPQVRLVIYGARRPRGRAPRAEVFVRPSLRRLRAVYGLCDVWLAPSHSEGFGLPVLEAMACRVVPVATRAGGHEEIVEEGASGFLVPVGDTSAMADRISVLVQDEALLARMSEAAYERSLAFDWDRSTDRLEALLRDWSA